MNKGFPIVLNDWTLEQVQLVTAQGVLESDRFDLKLELPNRKDSKSKDRLKKTCAAFANGEGGFLVYGVSDDKTCSPDERIIGLPADRDFAEHFGVFPSQCVPSVQWDYLRQAIVLKNGNLVHVVFIPKSWNAPHAIELEAGKWIFPKRTNKGNETMNMEEIKFMFLNYYEKRIRLQLLKSELEQFKFTAAGIANVDPSGSGAHYSLVTFDLAIVNSVLSETYNLLSLNAFLMSKLNQLRFQVRVTNTEIELFLRKASMPLTEMLEIVVMHNKSMKFQCQCIHDLSVTVLFELERVLSAKSSNVTF